MATRGNQNKAKMGMRKVTSIRRGGLKTDKKATRRPGSPCSISSGYSLYSTDTDDPVASTHRGLDRCAALLANMMDIDGMEKEPIKLPRPAKETSRKKTGGVNTNVQVRSSDWPRPKRGTGDQGSSHLSRRSKQKGPGGTSQKRALPNAHGHDIKQNDKKSTPFNQHLLSSTPNRRKHQDANLDGKKRKKQSRETSALDPSASKQAKEDHGIRRSFGSSPQQLQQLVDSLHPVQQLNSSSKILATEQPLNDNVITKTKVVPTITKNPSPTRTTVPVVSNVAPTPRAPLQPPVTQLSQMHQHQGMNGRVQQPLVVGTTAATYSVAHQTNDQHLHVSDVDWDRRTDTIPAHTHPETHPHTNSHKHPHSHQQPQVYIPYEGQPEEHFNRERVTSLPIHLQTVTHPKHQDQAPVDVSSRPHPGNGGHSHPGNMVVEAPLRSRSNADHSSWSSSQGHPPVALGRVDDHHRERSTQSVLRDLVSKLQEMNRSQGQHMESGVPQVQSVTNQVPHLQRVTNQVPHLQSVTNQVPLLSEGDHGNVHLSGRAEPLNVAETSNKSGQVNARSQSKDGSTELVQGVLEERTGVFQDVTKTITHASRRKDDDRLGVGNTDRREDLSGRSHIQHDVVHDSGQLHEEQFPARSPVHVETQMQKMADQFDFPEKESAASHTARTSVRPKPLTPDQTSPRHQRSTSTIDCGSQNTRSCDPQTSKENHRDTHTCMQSSSTHPSSRTGHTREAMTKKIMTPPSKSHPPIVTRDRGSNALWDQVRTLKYLVKELQGAVVNVVDLSAQNLLTELEEAIETLPYTSLDRDLQTEISLALQPMRSENSQLRRRLRIANQQLRQWELRAQGKENNQSGVSFEVLTLQSLNVNLQKQVEELQDEMERQQTNITEMRATIKNLATDKQNMQDIFQKMNTDMNKKRQEWTLETANLRQELGQLNTQLKSESLRFESMEKEREILKLSVKQRDKEIDRLQEMTKNMQQILSTIVPVSQKSPKSSLPEGNKNNRLEDWLEQQDTAMATYGGSFGFDDVKEPSPHSRTMDLDQTGKHSPQRSPVRPNSRNSLSSEATPVNVSTVYKVLQGRTNGQFLSEGNDTYPYTDNNKDKERNSDLAHVGMEFSDILSKRKHTEFASLAMPQDIADSIDLDTTAYLSFAGPTIRHQNAWMLKRMHLEGSQSPSRDEALLSRISSPLPGIASRNITQEGGGVPKWVDKEPSPVIQLEDDDADRYGVGTSSSHLDSSLKDISDVKSRPTVGPGKSRTQSEPRTNTHHKSLKSDFTRRNSNLMEIASVVSESTISSVASQYEARFQQGLSKLDADIAVLQANLKGLRNK